MMQPRDKNYTSVRVQSSEGCRVEVLATQALRVYRVVQLVEYPGDLKVNLGEYLGMIQGLQ